MSRNRFSATSAVNGSDRIKFQVEAACPQCGAPVALREGEHILSCSYCKTRQLLVEKDYPAFFVKPSVPSDSLFFAPYWLIQGQYYLVDSEQLLDMSVDVNFLAAKDGVIPYSLGLRHQALKLTALRPQDPIRALKMDVPRKTILDLVGRINRFRARGSKDRFKTDSSEQEEPAPETDALRCFANPFEGSKLPDLFNFLKRAAESENPVFRRTLEKTDNPGLNGFSCFDEFIENRFALMYFPYSIQNRVLMDGITGSPAETMSPLRLEELTLENQPSADYWTSYTLLCPGCGGDLDARSDGIVLPCSNCGKAWSVRGDGLVECPVRFHGTGSRDGIGLPFWRMTATLNGLKKWKIGGNIGGAYEIAFDPSASVSSVFWAPAFRCAPQVFLRTAARISTVGPRGMAEPALNHRRLFPVTVQDFFAFRHLRMILFEMARLKGYPLVHSQNFKDLSFRLQSSDLVYMPFDRIGTELVHPGFPLAVPQFGFRGITTVEEVMSGR